MSKDQGFRPYSGDPIFNRIGRFYISHSKHPLVDARGTNTEQLVSTLTSNLVSIGDLRGSTRNVLWLSDGDDFFEASTARKNPYRGDTIISKDNYSQLLSRNGVPTAPYEHQWENVDALHLRFFWPWAIGIQHFVPQEGDQTSQGRLIVFHRTKPFLSDYKNIQREQLKDRLTQHQIPAEYADHINNPPAWVRILAFGFSWLKLTDKPAENTFAQTIRVPLRQS